MMAHLQSRTSATSIGPDRAAMRSVYLAIGEVERLVNAAVIWLVVRQHMAMLSSHSRLQG
jgi:hypothetical protein